MISTSTPRNEEHSRFRRAGAFGHGAEQKPLRMIAAAGEAPSAAQPMTAGHDLRRAVRRDTRRRDGVGIVVPHLVLRALRKIADHPAVLAMHGGDPGRRAAALGQRAEHFGEHAVVGAEAAEHPGLQAAGQPEAAEIVDGFLRQTALGGGLFGALAQSRDERAGALDEDFRVLHAQLLPVIPTFIGTEWHESRSTSCPALCRASRFTE